MSTNADGTVEQERQIYMTHQTLATMRLEELDAKQYMVTLRDKTFRILFLGLFALPIHSSLREKTYEVWISTDDGLYARNSTIKVEAITEYWALHMAEELVYGNTFFKMDEVALAHE